MRRFYIALATVFAVSVMAYGDAVVYGSAKAEEPNGPGEYLYDVWATTSYAGMYGHFRWLEENLDTRVYLEMTRMHSLEYYGPLARLRGECFVANWTQNELEGNRHLPRTGTPRLFEALFLEGGRDFGFVIVRVWHLNQNPETDMPLYVRYGWVHNGGVDVLIDPVPANGVLGGDLDGVGVAYGHGEIKIRSQRLEARFRFWAANTGVGTLDEVAWHECRNGVETDVWMDRVEFVGIASPIAVLGGYGYHNGTPRKVVAVAIDDLGGNDWFWIRDWHLRQNPETDPPLYERFHHVKDRRCGDVVVLQRPEL